MSKPTCTNSPKSSSVACPLELRLHEIVLQAMYRGTSENKPIASEATTDRLEVKECYVVIFSQKHIVAVIAVRIHLFPFRTEKLSSPSPMVLPHQVGE